jgi:hypothetical protein
MSVFSRLFHRDRDDKGAEPAVTPAAAEPAPVEPARAAAPAAASAPVAPAAPPVMRTPPPQPSPVRAAVVNGGPVARAAVSPAPAATSTAKAAPAAAASAAAASAVDDSLAASVEAAVDSLIARPAPPARGPRAPGNGNGNGKANGKGGAHPSKPAGKPGTPVEGVSSAADMAALHTTYAELSVEYCAPVRNAMLEVRWGEPPLGWIGFVRSALGSLRTMADQVELRALAGALGDFNRAVDTALGSGKTAVDAELRKLLLDAYQPLIACLPRAFDLDGERDRREPIILRSLLLQVPGVMPLSVERCLAAGLNRLETIIKAPAEDLAAVTSIELPVAVRILELLRAEGRVGAANASDERQRLQTLVGELSEAHAGFERAAASWGVSSRADKQRSREQRERSWLKIQVVLARLGEVERIERCERLPFARKIEELERLLRPAAPVVAARARGATPVMVTATEPNSPRGI